MLRLNSLKQWTFERVSSGRGSGLRSLLLDLGDPIVRSDTLVLTLLAGAIGCTTALGAAAFHHLLESTDDIWHAAVAELGVGGGRWLIALLPVAGALVAVGLIRAFARNDTSHGTSAVIESVALKGGRLPARALLTKVAAAAVFIGSGGSAGPEDPSVQLGGVVGSSISRFFGLSPKRTRTLVACGVAGAVAAAFNAPIAGVFFALEVVVGDMSSALFAPVVIAAVSSSALGRWLNGDHPAFQVPAYELGSALLELPLYVLLGVVTALAGVAFIRLLFAVEDWFGRMDVSRVARALGVGILIGIIGLWLPEVVGVGYRTVGSVLLGRSADPLDLGALFAVKLALTATCIAAVGVGGTFAPSLFIGAMLGGLYGIGVHEMLPEALPAAYALVAMGGVLTAVVRAPITAVLLIFEVTNDYRIILPIMLTVAISNVVATALHRESIYTERLVRHGVRLRRGEHSEVLELIRVADAMSDRFVVVQWHQSLGEVLQAMTESHHQAAPVADGESLVGIVTAGDIMRALERGVEPDCPVGEIAVTDLVVAHPEQSLHDALLLFAAREVRQVPVVTTGPERAIIGLLRRSDIVVSYSSAVGQRAARGPEHAAHGAHAPQSRHHRIEMADGMPALGRRVGGLTLPDGVLLVAIDRHGWTRKPRESMTLESGDVLTLLGHEPGIREATRMLTGEHPGSNRNTT